MAIAPTQIFNQVRVAKNRADTKYLSRKKFGRTMGLIRGKNKLRIKLEKGQALRPWDRQRWVFMRIILITLYYAQSVCTTICYRHIIYHRYWQILKCISRATNPEMMETERGD